MAEKKKPRKPKPKKMNTEPEVKPLLDATNAADDQLIQAAQHAVEQQQSHFALNSHVATNALAALGLPIAPPTTPVPIQQETAAIDGLIHRLEQTLLERISEDRPWLAVIRNMEKVLEYPESPNTFVLWTQTNRLFQALLQHRLDDLDETEFIALTEIAEVLQQQPSGLREMIHAIEFLMLLEKLRLSRVESIEQNRWKECMRDLQHLLNADPELIEEIRLLEFIRLLQILLETNPEFLTEPQLAGLVHMLDLLLAKKAELFDQDQLIELIRLFKKLPQARLHSTREFEMIEAVHLLSDFVERGEKVVAAWALESDSKSANPPYNP